MIENLKVASESLHAALEQYLRVCDGLYGSYSQGKAQPMSLDIHIAGTRNRPSTYNYISLVKFLESLAGRMKALELIITEEQINEFYSLVLEKLLPKANPNIFTRFIIYAQNQHYDVFITPPESRRHSYGNRPDRSHFPVDVSSEVLDRTFTSLKTLHARGVFPPWHSKAYHGLVELRLTSIDGLYSGIAEQELMSILKASPRLQILHFALDIINQNSCFLNGPISLHELEELVISASYEFQTEPTLELELVFSHLSGGEWGCGFKEEELRRAIKDAPTVKSHLKSWTLRNCTIYLKELQLMLDLYPTKSLVLHNSNVWEDEEVEERISETKLPIMFPAVKFIQDQPEYTYSRRHSEAESDSDS
ncbi:hypothetical protein RSAG8_13591, partial [Rhizoctonia solani AG-8 WAC10335]